ncbi:MAG TPA: SPASM domain-containing protein [bacterium]|nr:SPASM domain-containing protein [bacterium]HPN43983.1 SPASM domain-containing protein [bacterium]
MELTQANVFETLQKYELAENHYFQMGGYTIFYNVKQMGVYVIHEEHVRQFIEFFSGGKNPQQLTKLCDLYGIAQVREDFEALKNIGLLISSELISQQGTVKPPSCHRDRYMSALVVNLCHDCNFRCSYCFANQGLYRKDRRYMDWKTAKATVDFLIAKANPDMKKKKVRLELFGGEPLMNMPVIRKLVAYREEVKEKTGFEIGMSLPTNGLLLTKQRLDFCDEHQIGVQVSIDGPPEIQDRYRKLANGEGSYAAIIDNVKRLIAKRKKINARATIGRNDVHLLEVAKHLIDEVGFASVFIAESTGVEGCSGTASNTAVDLQEINSQLYDVAEEYIRRARNGEVYNLNPFAHAVSRLWNPKIKNDACGAGKGYLTVAVDGSLYPCMRFIDMKEYYLGNVFDGEINEAIRDKFYNNTVDSKEECSHCWGRYLCGGSCVFLPIEYHGSLDKQPQEICDTYRRRFECAMYAMAVLHAEGYQLKNNRYVKVI